MSKEERAILNQNAQDFVRRVITEVYGQKATNTAVRATAQRVIAALPQVTEADAPVTSPSQRGYADMKPTLIRREDGGWLAVSPADANLHIGVVAWSADDARARFVRAAREWGALLDGRYQDEVKLS